MKILETNRTTLRQLDPADAPFMLDLLNQPTFIKYIGDRKIRKIEQARDYIETRFIESYKKFGHGLYLVELKETGAPIGINGFVKRDSLPEPDIGFAFLPDYYGKGYALESSLALIDYGRDVLKMPRVLAITTQDNNASGKLLERIGLKFERLIIQPHDTEELKLFSIDF